MRNPTTYSRRIAHAHQRSFYRLDSALDELVETVPPVARPEPIPVGEATESDWGEFQDAVWGDL